MVETGRDRAQLILVGGITLALAIISIAVVVNTVLYTESVQTSETDAALTESSQIEYQTTRSVRSLVLRVNHQSRNHGSAEIERWVAENVSSWNRVRSEAYASSQSMMVNVSYNAGPSTHGVRVVQSDDGTFEESGRDTWRPIPDGSHRVGWFVTNLNMTQTDRAPSDPFTVVIENSTESVEITLNKTSRTEVEVESDVSHAGDATATCRSRGGRLLLNLYTGRSYTDGGCTFNGTSELANPSSVRFENGHVITGKYSLVANETTGPITDWPTECRPSVDRDDPCRTPVIWSANVSTAVVKPDYESRNTHNVSVYGGGR